MRAVRVGLLAALSGGAECFSMGVSARGAVVNMHSKVSAEMSFFDQSATAIGGETVSMSTMKGKPTLILNVASL
jgi:hypothetical protein